MEGAATRVNKNVQQILDQYFTQRKKTNTKEIEDELVEQILLNRSLSIPVTTLSKKSLYYESTLF